MGASPQQKALEAAKQSVEAAQSQQQKLYRDIKGSARKYSKKTMGQLDTLEGASGTTLPDYISAVKQQFGNIPTIEATQQKYQQALSNFDPGLIGSASDRTITSVFDCKVLNNMLKVLVG
jgi:BRCT domain type II-containing protein